MQLITTVYKFCVFVESVLYLEQFLVVHDKNGTVWKYKNAQQ